MALTNFLELKSRSLMQNSLLYYRQFQWNIQLFTQTVARGHLRGSVTIRNISDWLTMQHTLPWPANKLSHLTIACKNVNSTTHATEFQLQPFRLCKETWLSIKFAHPDWRMICKKRTLLGCQRRARRTVKPAKRCWELPQFWRFVQNV